jgi:hypothetical protein
VQCDEQRRKQLARLAAPLHRSHCTVRPCVQSLNPTQTMQRAALTAECATEVG